MTLGRQTTLPRVVEQHKLNSGFFFFLQKEIKTGSWVDKEVRAERSRGEEGEHGKNILCEILKG